VKSISTCVLLYRTNEYCPFTPIELSPIETDADSAADSVKQANAEIATTRDALKTFRPRQEYPVVGEFHWKDGMGQSG
jgi:hypothetical protein